MLVYPSRAQLNEKSEEDLHGRRPLFEDDLNSWNLAKIASKHVKVYSRTPQTYYEYFDKKEDKLNGRRLSWKKTSIEITNLVF